MVAKQVEEVKSQEQIAAERNRVLANVLAELGGVKKNKKNSHFSSSYADLGAILEHITEPLAEVGFQVQQTVKVFEGSTEFQPNSIKTGLGFFLYTHIVDLEHNRIMCSMDYPLVAKDYNDPQKVGGAVTYARRYSLLTILGMAAEDDDGNAAATPPKSTPTEAKAPSKAEIVKKVQTKHKVNDALDLEKLTALVLGEDNAVRSFASLSLTDLNKLAAYESKGESAPF